MALSCDEAIALAETRYNIDTYENRENQLFALLVDVADAYRTELEHVAADHPAPFLGGTTPLDVLILGLRENLEIRRDPTAA
jgi:hypothetical protein